jgi:enoyl-CoA hydratase/carnithine racemase
MTRWPYGTTARYDPSVAIYYELESLAEAYVLRLAGDDTNRLTRARVVALTKAVQQLANAKDSRALIITGNDHFFSAGADLNEIAALTGPVAYEFSAMGQALMNAVAEFPAPTFAAVRGYCMGGGLDLALACCFRIAHPNAVFGHRGAALGLITGWGGTQRLPRLVGKARALEMFVAAEKLHANRALEIGLIDAIDDNPISHALSRITPMARSHEGE